MNGALEESHLPSALEGFQSSHIPTDVKQIKRWKKGGSTLITENGYHKWTVAKLNEKVLDKRLLSPNVKESHRLKAIMGLLSVQGVFEETDDDDHYQGWKSTRLKEKIKDLFQDVTTEKSQLVALLFLSDCIEHDDASSQVPSDSACTNNGPTLMMTSEFLRTMTSEENESSHFSSLLLSDTAEKDIVNGTEQVKSLFRSLTHSEKKMVDDALNGEGNLHQVLAEYQSKETGFVDSIQRESMRRLKPGKWLNDEVIHFFYLMLAQRDADLAQVSPRRRCHFFKSFFITKLLDEGVTYQYTFSNVKQ